MRICCRLTATLLCALTSGALPALIHAEPEPSSLSAGTSAGTLLPTPPSPASPQHDAAVAGLAALAAHLPASTPAAQAGRIFNVDDSRTLRAATIGDGFEMFFVDPQAVLAGKPIDQSLHESGIWRFIVLAHGKGIGLITVARMNGNWTMVEAGASELADEIATVAAYYGRQVPQPQLRVIRCQQAVADFIEVSSPPAVAQSTAPVYVPLASTRTVIAEPRAGANARSPVLSEAALGDTLRRRLQRGLGDPRFGH